MHTEERRPVGKDDRLLRRQVVEQTEHAGLVQDASRPGGTGRHESVAADEVDVGGRRVGRRMRVRLVVGEDVTVGVAADERDIASGVEQLEHLDRARTEQDEVAECPPPFDAHPHPVLEHRIDGDGDAVEVGDHAQAHASR